MFCALPPAADTHQVLHVLPVGVNESSLFPKRPCTSEVINVNPKKSKPSESVSGANSSAVFPSAKSLSVTSPQAMSSKEARCTKILHSGGSLSPACALSQSGSLWGMSN
ncbi:Zinc finger protein 280D [Myotis brandtii]|uniref:Zinc finger protein 280D n=1 Tax=Myotis brandtii TaxID=109478 RepID=S7MXK0_MYOBR|nr:Zinc finger protein 280D [Myotis brandtii]